MRHIYPSLIASDLLDLQKTILQLNPHCPGYHLDIMDDHFVPNLTWGPAFINAIAHASKNHTIWVHLMVENPHSFLDRLSLQPGSIFTFHQEATSDHEALITKIHAKKWRAGIALSPNTGIDTIVHLAPMVEQILIMSVEPGFSGQAFIEKSYEKVAQLHAYKKQHSLSFSIAVDGGINKKNIQKLQECGADSFGVASAIFDQEDPVAALQELKELSYKKN